MQHAMLQKNHTFTSFTRVAICKVKMGLELLSAGLLKLA